MESIALARPAGYWHGGATPGPHLVDWQEGREVTPATPMEADIGGAFAAGWLLDRMEEADPPRPVLVEWLDIAMARRTLVAPLSILSRLNRMAGDGSIELASRIAALVPRAWDLDFDGAAELEQTLLSREGQVRSALADALDEIIHRRGTAALPFNLPSTKQSTSTVGLPRLSSIIRALNPLIFAPMQIPVVRGRKVLDFKATEVTDLTKPAILLLYFPHLVFHTHHNILLTNNLP